MKIYTINNTENAGIHHNYSNSFKGYVGGKYYSEEIINLAKKYLKENAIPNVDEFKKSFADCWGEAKVQPMEWAFAPFVAFLRKVYDDVDTSITTMELSRVITGICTLGLSELLKTPEAGIRKLKGNSEASKKLNEVLECMLALKNEDKK